MMDDSPSTKPQTKQTETVRQQDLKIFICRNIVYSCTVDEPKPYKPPCALNWRYQVTGQVYNQVTGIEHKYIKPRALNWRWQNDLN